MDLEVREIPPQSRGMYSNRMRSYKQEMGKLEADFVSHIPSFVTVTDLYAEVLLMSSDISSTCLASLSSKRATFRRLCKTQAMPFTVCDPGPKKRSQGELMMEFKGRWIHDSDISKRGGPLSLGSICYYLAFIWTWKPNFRPYKVCRLFNAIFTDGPKRFTCVLKLYNHVSPNDV